MSDKKALVPVEQREVEFYDDAITALLSDDGTIYVPVRPICEALGVAWDPQRRRIYRDPILAESVKSVTVTVADIDPGNDSPPRLWPRKQLVADWRRWRRGCLEAIPWLLQGWRWSGRPVHALLG